MAFVLGNGATVTIGATTYSDAVAIGIPGKEAAKIDVTNLGSTQVEYIITSIFDQPEIAVTVPLGTFPSISDTPVAFDVTANGGSLTGSNVYCKVIGVLPAPVEVNGKLTMEIKLQPCPAP